MTRTRMEIVAIVTCLLSAFVAGTAAAQVPAVSDLAIEKTADQEVALVGDEVAYTITVTNAGPDAAEDVVVADLLPDVLDPISITASGIGTCSLTPTASCTFASIPVGGEETVTLDASPLHRARGERGIGLERLLRRRGVEQPSEVHARRCPRRLHGRRYTRERRPDGDAW